VEDLLYLEHIMWSPRHLHYLARVPIRPLSWPAYAHPIDFADYIDRFPFEAAIRVTYWRRYSTLSISTEVDETDLPVFNIGGYPELRHPSTIQDAMASERNELRAREYVEYVNDRFRETLTLMDTVQEVPNDRGDRHDALRTHRDRQRRELKLALREWFYGDRHLALIKLHEAERNNYLFYEGGHIPPTINLAVTIPRFGWRVMGSMTRQSRLPVEYTLHQVLTAYVGLMMEYARHFNDENSDNPHHEDRVLPTNDEVDTVHHHAFAFTRDLLHGPRFVDTSTGRDRRTTRLTRSHRWETALRDELNNTRTRSVLNDIMEERQSLPNHSPRNISTVREYTVPPMLSQFMESSSYPLFLGTQNGQSFRDEFGYWSLFPNLDGGPIRIVMVSNRSELSDMAPGYPPLEDVEYYMRPRQRRLPVITRDLLGTSTFRVVHDPVRATHGEAVQDEDQHTGNPTILMYRLNLHVE
jgi:hypothetical protein